MKKEKTESRREGIVSNPPYVRVCSSDGGAVCEIPVWQCRVRFLRRKSEYMAVEVDVDGNGWNWMLNRSGTVVPVESLSASSTAEFWLKAEVAGLVFDGMLGFSEAEAEVAALRDENRRLRSELSKWEQAFGAFSRKVSAEERDE